MARTCCVLQASAILFSCSMFLSYCIKKKRFWSLFSLFNSHSANSLNKKSMFYHKTLIQMIHSNGNSKTFTCPTLDTTEYKKHFRHSIQDNIRGALFCTLHSAQGFATAACCLLQTLHTAHYQSHIIPSTLIAYFIIYVNCTAVELQEIINGKQIQSSWPVPSQPPLSSSYYALWHVNVRATLHTLSVGYLIETCCLCQGYLSVITLGKAFIVKALEIEFFYKLTALDLTCVLCVQ